MTTKVGVVGTGFAATSHIEALHRLPQVQLVALAGSSRAKADAAAAGHGVEKAFGSFHELIHDDDIEVVHNCTPNFLHAKVNAAAMDAGKHILSEKPLAMNSAETAALVQQAEASDVVSGVCFNYRHYPMVRQAKAIIDSADYGPVNLAHGSYLQDWLLYADDWNWRLESDKAGSSRAIADIGSHWLDLVQYVTGQRVSELCADLSTIHTSRLRPAEGSQTFASADSTGAERVAVDTEDFGNVLLRFDNGARGAMSISQVSPGRKNRLWFEIDTASVSVVWDQEEPNHLWLGRRDEANRELVRDPGLLEPEAARLAHFPAGHQEGWPDGLKNMFIDFYGAVDAFKGGDDYSSSFATFTDAHQVLSAVEAIVASHQSRKWIKVTNGLEAEA
ncbi:MAG: Gfo/Idh/MocA family oxidoreductase [Actinomycetota bacterium]|nr:Gfo/Idh/MocA family oxidoreductase [Actinomycetota bacterium]